MSAARWRLEVAPMAAETGEAIVLTGSGMSMTLLRRVFPGSQDADDALSVIQDWREAPR